MRYLEIKSLNNDFWVYVFARNENLFKKLHKYYGIYVITEFHTKNK